MRFKYLVAFLSVFILLEGFSQRKKDQDTSNFIIQPNRIEFKIGRYDEDFHIISGEENGMLVVKETAVSNPEGYGWVLTCLDTAFNLEWESLAVIPHEYNYIGWDYNSEYYYLLFSRNNYKPGELTIYQVALKDGKIKEKEISTVFPMVLSHFEVIDDVVILGGTTNFKPAVLTFDLEKLNPRVIPGIYNGNNEIVDISVDDDAGVFSVIMIEKVLNRQVSISAKTFTTENILIQNNLINPGERYSLIDGATTDFQGGFQYIAGTYSNKSLQYSRGLYISKFINGRQQFINFINYADLENFFDYMREKRVERIKQRIERRRSKGKKVRFSYRLLIHDIIQRDDHYILIAEAYYPRYSHSQQFMSPYSYGRVPSGFTGVSGYKYTHAIVVAFDQNGTKLWDHSFAIDDVFTYSLEEFVTVNVFRDQIELCYLEENLIRSKLIKGNKVIEGKSYTPVRLGSEKDEVRTRDPEIEGLENWYDDYMYAFGEQTIQHTLGSNGTSLRREVFYINKVRYKLNRIQK